MKMKGKIVESEILRTTTTSLEPTKSQDSYLGCMLGLAVGDAVGYPVEFKRHGPFTVSDMTIGFYSDDTQMSIATAEGLISSRGRPVESVYHAYLNWLRTQSDPHQHRAPGGTCLSALSSGKMGTIENKLTNSKGCGGVMRVAPAGLVFSTKTALRCGAEFAAITHGHPSGYLSAGFLAELISHLINGKGLDESLDSSINTLIGYDGHEETLRKVLQARDLAKNNAAYGIDAIGEGWIGEEALGIAIYCSLRFRNDFKAGILAAVNHSGDSDSTGSITGAILGTLLGVQAIPTEWVNKVENSHYLKTLAKSLYELDMKDENKQPQNSVYPLTVKCPICFKTIRISNAGRFRCPFCKTVFIFDKKGKIILV
jgi:ADP-ribosylglycohydrolase